METSIDYSKLSTRELYELTAKAEGYESVPVDIDTFLNDPYYLGQTYDNGKAVYSYWREALHKIYPNPLYSPYEEVAVTGCIGAGKALSTNEIVVCRDGKKKAKDVTLCDEVLGTDGGFHPVLGIFPQGVKHTYALYVQVEGAAKDAPPVDRIITSDEHIWTAYEDGRKFDILTCDIVSRLNEGRTLYIPTLENEPRRYFCGWADTGDRECVCFKVGSPDHLFAVSNNTFTHNTSFAIMGALYDLYHVCLLREPQKKYKLLKTTRILFSLVTATKDLAAAVMANQMLDVIAASPFFTSRFMPKKGEKLDEDMFPHHVGVGFGSRGGHNLGKAVIGAIIDEANFQEAVANQAVKNYETITRRMSSRFKLKNGSLPCRRWLVSSRNSDSSFLESHIEAVKNNPKVLVLAPAIWDVQKEKGIYSGKTFPVFIGTNTQQPMICTTEKEVEDHAGYIIEVPDVYREEFEENLPGALMDLAGVANRSSMSLIYNVEKWVACQCLDNAISKDEITLSIDGVDKIMDYMAKELPKHNYYVHLDGALKGDRFGFAMSAIEKQMTVSGRNLLTGEQTLRLSPSLITPIVFGIKARPGSEVPLWKVRQFLLDLRNKGVCIMQVSTDGFQSADMRQMLEKMGFNVKYVSVDTTKDPYLKFASNINHGLMKVPKSPILDFEVRHLENRDKKIDHPDKVMVNGRYVKGSKDIADAVSASQHEALLASLSLSAGTLVEQLGETQHLSIRGRQEYVQDMIFGMVQGNPDEHIAGGMY